MWIRELLIENFRGIKSALVEFSERQTVLVGSNGAGKSTILESFALIFGRDRLVRTLTEHDFYGSNPGAGDRIRLVATTTGFSSNIASAHSQWFSESRGVPKWFRRSTGKLLSEPQSADDDYIAEGTWRLVGNEEDEANAIPAQVRSVAGPRNQFPLRTRHPQGAFFVGLGEGSVRVNESETPGLEV
ncbi:MAG: ATP-dependent nuclease [Terriglobia bacterium]